MEIRDLFQTKIANALHRAGFESVEDLIQNFDKIGKDGKYVRELGKNGYAYVEYVLKVELP